MPFIHCILCVIYVRSTWHSKSNMKNICLMEALRNLAFKIRYLLYLIVFPEKHDSGNLYFCFRWLLICFKREFSFPDIMTLWEVRPSPTGFETAIRTIYSPLLKREGNWSRNTSRTCLWDRYWGRVGQLLAIFFSVLSNNPKSLCES